MRQLYYTVYHNVYDDGSKNGLRDIYVYDIVDNTPMLVGHLIAKSDTDGNYFMGDEEEIQEWLDNNSEEFNTENIDYEFIEL